MKTKLTAIALASATALVAISDVAAARSGHGHQGMSHQMTRKPPVQKGSKNAHLYMHKKHKGCGKLIVPTAGCPTPVRDPVGNTRPSLPTEAKQPVDKSRQPVLESVDRLSPQSANRPANAPAQPAAAPAGIVAVSNGVTNTTLDPGRGLTVSSNGSGAISVSNGTHTVTLAGGSVTLHGAPAVTAGAGVQVVRLANGNYAVAASPAPAAPSRNVPVPPGVTIADDAKFVGHTLLSIPEAPVVGITGIVGLPIAATVGAIEGHPAKTVGKYLDSLGSEITGVFE